MTNSPKYKQTAKQNSYDCAWMSYIIRLIFLKIDENSSLTFVHQTSKPR